MKKLSKLKLNDFHEMTDMEMKNVVGGSGAGGKCPVDGGEESSQCNGSCWLGDTMEEGTCEWEEIKLGTITMRACTCTSN